MLFTDFYFILLFLPGILFLYYATENKEHRIKILLVGSLLFYGSWNIFFLPLLLISILQSYYFSIWINNSKGNLRQFVACLAVILSLLPLSFFKYGGFIIENFSLKVDEFFIYKGLIPLGISFYTFQQITYLIDIYQKKLRRSQSLVHYAFFVSFFPQLIAGPIVHYKEIACQFGKTFRANEFFFRGVLYFLIGFAKKFFIADRMALIANPHFLNPENLSFSQSLEATLGYTFQIYFDFSGYSDMAIGLGLMVGFRLPINFQSPYKAGSIVEFWKRWHITLSTFLREYIYIPMGGNRKGAMRRRLNMLITMLIGGLWHGAAWTFVVWGGLHGLALMVNSIFSRHFAFGRFRAIGTGLTFVFVSLSWVLFRAENFGTAMQVYKGFFNFELPAVEIGQLSLFVFGFLLVFGPNSHQIVPIAEKINSKFKEYIFTLASKRLIFQNLIGFSFVIMFAFGFYEKAIDKNIYKWLPLKYSELGHISTGKGDYRSNFYSNWILQGGERKTVFIGSSFTTYLGEFIYTTNGGNYKSGSLGMGGNGIINGYRAATILLEERGVHTVVLGIHALNFGNVISHDIAFPKQCLKRIGDLVGLGVSSSNGTPHTPQEFISDRFGSCQPIKMTWQEKLHLAFNLQSPIYYQLQGFWFKVLHANLYENNEIKNIDLNSAEYQSFLKILEKQRENSVLEEVPPKSTNGFNTTFKWRWRWIYQSLNSGGWHSNALLKLADLAVKNGKRLVIYDTPTPKYHDQLPFMSKTADNIIFEYAWYEGYLARIKKIVDIAEVPYIDLTGFFPWRENFMADFIHPQDNKRPLIHKRLLFLVDGDQK
jgi:alginate O-acetyltransferase complex protein AlgI